MAGVDIDDLCQLISGIKLQALDDTKTIAQWRRKAAGTGCGADQRERRQIYAQAARTWSFADDDIEDIVLMAE